MDALTSLGRRIQDDVRRLIAIRADQLPPDIELLDADDFAELEAVTELRVRRRRDEAASLLSALANEDAPFGMPVIGEVSSAFGMRFHPIDKKWKRHTGEDIRAALGTPVWAAADGTVVIAGRVKGYGNLVAIDHGSGMVTRYGHLNEIMVNVGSQVKRGDTIGTVGKTGKATGSHLHFEVIERNKFRDPGAFLRGTTATEGAVRTATRAAPPRQESRVAVQ